MPIRPYPMGVGLETDMETGQPLAVEQLARDVRRDALHAQALERHQRLLSDLSGQGGAVLREVAEKLATRVNALMAADPEASAYLGLLGTVAQQLSVGERIAQDALAKVFDAGGMTTPKDST